MIQMLDPAAGDTVQYRLSLSLYPLQTVACPLLSLLWFLSLCQLQCEPNLFAKIMDVRGMKTGSVIMFITRRTIHAGEELT